jgi:beta-glucosidase
LNLGWAKANADAVIEAWYPGERGGSAVGRVMTGAVNPGGRLPVTFYNSVYDLPAFEDYNMANRTYRYFKGTPLYPFGYGLSYTTFAYAPVTVRRTPKGAQVGTTVSNIGKRAGDEVAQLYLTFPDAPGAPRIALRGFQRLHLAAGAKQRVTFMLNDRDLSSVRPDGTRSVAAGRYTVSVGGGQPGTDAPSQTAPLNIAHDIAVREASAQ